MIEPVGISSRFLHRGGFEIGRGADRRFHFAVELIESFAGRWTRHHADKEEHDEGEKSIEQKLRGLARGG